VKKEALFEKALRFIKHKEYDRAEDIVKQLIRENPDKESLLLTLGNIHLFKNKTKQALDAYERALQIAPENPDIYTNIALIYKQQGNADNAISFLQKALSFTKERADIYYNLGNVYKQSKNYDDAEEAFLEAVELNPEFANAYNNLGSLYIETGNLERAREIIEKGLSADENHPRLLYNLGVIKDLQGKSEEAIESYKRSIITQPLWVESINNLGIAYHKSNMHGKAIKTFNNALNVEPDNFVVKNNIATAYKTIGEEKKAKEYYRKALFQNPEYVKASLNLSDLYRETGDFDNALQELSRIETLKPDDGEIKIHKAHVYFDKGDFDNAEEIIARSAENDSNPAAFALKALLSIKKGNQEEAAKYIEKADALEPGNLSLKNAKAELYKQQGDLQKAENEFRDILSLNKGTLKASLELVKILKTQEKFDDALFVLNSLEGDYKSYNETVAEYSDIYKKSGQTEKALEYSNQFLSKMGKDDSQIDISSLNKGIELFEEASKSYELLHNPKMEERLSDFVKKYIKSEQDKVTPQDAVSFLVGSIEGLNDEQVPIINIGGIEPVIEINEEEEILVLKEQEENFDDEEKGPGFYEEAKEKLEKEVLEKLGVEKNLASHFFPPQGLNFPVPPSGTPFFPAQPQFARPSPAAQAMPTATLPPSQPHEAQSDSFPATSANAKQSAPKPSISAPNPPPSSKAPPAPQTHPAPSAKQATLASQPPSAKQAVPASKASPAPQTHPALPAKQAAPASQEPPAPQEDLPGKHDGAEKPEGDSFTSPKKNPEYVNKNIANLLDKLGGLTDYLNDGKKDTYENSIMKLKVEALKRKLNGNKGLWGTLKEIEPEKRSNKDRRNETDRRNEERRREADRRSKTDRRNDETKKNITKDELENTFTYIKGLADFLPQKVGGNVLKHKIKNLLEKIENE